MLKLPPITLRFRGKKIIGPLAFAILLAGAILFGAGSGLLFVYGSDLPAVRALEDYQPNIVTEIYADDGQQIASFALQRRMLLTYEQIPPVLRNAILVAEDQHFMEHWGVDFPRVLMAAWRNLTRMRIAEGASTLTMQLAGRLFLDRSDRSFRRKIQETLLAIQIERRYTKQQIFTMYCNQIYLAHGNYGFEAASRFYFSKPVGELTLPEAALLAGMIRGPLYSPLLHPKRALERRNWVIERMAREGKIPPAEAQAALKLPIELRLDYPRNDLAPYFVEEIRKYLESTYGTEAVHENGLRVYTTLNVAMQQAANRAVLDGLHAYDRRHGWRGNLRNILRDHLGELDTYEDDDWRRPIAKGDYVTGLVTAVNSKVATVKLGPAHAYVAAADIVWTGAGSPAQLFKVGDLAQFHIEDISGSLAKVQLEQVPAVQGALVAIDNATGEIKALVGGYSFEDSKFNRATQAMRQVGSSFKPYLYAAALEQGFTPFDTILDAPFTTISGGQVYSPVNYDQKFEGMITLRRALDGSRNVPAVKLAEKVGINNVIDVARKFGITSPLPPYLPLALGAAQIKLIEHTSAFTVFPDDGIRIDPHMIRRVTTYDGALLEQAHPVVHDVISRTIARTMVAMLEDVVQYGTGVRARTLGRPSGGKTGTTNDFTDAWYMGFTPRLTSGVWVGFDDNQTSLGKGETGARAALPIWLQFMQDACASLPAENFENVVSLNTLAQNKTVRVDTPDIAPTDPEEQGLTPPKPPDAKPSGAAPPSPGAPGEAAPPPNLRGER